MSCQGVPSVLITIPGSLPSAQWLFPPPVSPPNMMEAPGQPQKGAGNSPGLLSPGLVPCSQTSARDTGCPLPVCSL